ncbi:MAG: hypothetical protein FWD37_01725, partial [Methanomassiliicoccaceae archaeon]|nr:hypothetical protein [Methanomassiliicoccaceae archaeon]
MISLPAKQENDNRSFIIFMDEIYLLTKVKAMNRICPPPSLNKGKLFLAFFVTAIMVFSVLPFISFDNDTDAEWSSSTISAEADTTPPIPGDLMMIAAGENHTVALK